MNDHFSAIFNALLVLAMTILILGSIGIWMDKRSCYSQLNIMQREGHFGMWEGCLIKTKEGLIPIKNLRVVE